MKVTSVDIGHYPEVKGKTDSILKTANMVSEIQRD
jgi:hypothetical protein